jgi:thiol-disulfide isomerase/thioredoxin
MVTVVVVAAALAFSACGGTSVSSGEGAPVELMQPADFSVADYAGKPLVVNFFGSWCGPCNAEAPALAAFVAAHPGMQFVGVAVEDSGADVTAFMNEYGLTYPVVMDDKSLGSQYGITGVPETLFFDAAGQQQDRIIGAASRDQFEASLAKVQ